MEQEKKKFTPTQEQLAFADQYILCSGNITEACEAIGNASRSAYYTWVKHEGFQEWLSEYAKKEVLKHIGKWYLLLEKYAEKGSYKHLEALLQIAKEFVPESKLKLDGALELEGELNLNGKFSRHADELLRRFGLSLS